LAGFVLVLGMLVDDAIVVAEQVNKEKEDGLEGKESAWVAVRKVWRPITGASITTILAYYPISQMGGLPGKFVWMIPAVVCIALFLSLFDSFFLLPHHLTHGKKEKITKGKYFLKLESFYK
jgi:multidrug efflux pump subunit AcrB